MFNHFFSGGTGSAPPNNPSDIYSQIAQASTPRPLGRGASETVTTSTSYDMYGNPTTTIEKTTTIQSAVGGKSMEIKNPDKVVVTGHRDGTTKIETKTTTSAPLPGMPTEYTSPTSLHVQKNTFETTYTPQYRSAATLGGEHVEIKQGPILVQNTWTGQYTRESRNPLSQDTSRTPVTLVGPQRTAIEQVTQILNQHTSTPANK
jgi:hypothetical protein